MQHLDLYDQEIIKLLLVCEDIIYSAIGILFIVSRGIFAIVRKQLKPETSPLVLCLFFGALYIFLVIGGKPIVTEFINYYQPTIKTPFFR